MPTKTKAVTGPFSHIMTMFVGQQENKEAGVITGPMADEQLDLWLQQGYELHPASSTSLHSRDVVRLFAVLIQPAK